MLPVPSCPHFIFWLSSSQRPSLFSQPCSSARLLPVLARPTPACLCFITIFLSHSHFCLLSCCEQSHNTGRVTAIICHRSFKIYIKLKTKQNKSYKKKSIHTYFWMDLKSFSLFCHRSFTLPSPPPHHLTQFAPDCGFSWHLWWTSRAGEAITGSRKQVLLPQAKKETIPFSCRNSGEEDGRQAEGGGWRESGTGEKDRLEQL